MIVRAFEPGDQSEARALIDSGLGERFGHIDRTANPDILDIEQAYIDSGHEFIVAVVNDHVVGTCGVLIEPDKAPRMMRLPVERSLRRQGAAKQLLTVCVERLSERGFRELVAYTEPHWDSAVCFYVGQGVVRYGRDREDIHLRLRW